MPSILHLLLAYNISTPKKKYIVIVTKKEVSRVKQSSVKILLFESYENGLWKVLEKKSVL